MDALARIEPVARPLLRAVDAALATLGAPPEHAVWPLLRRVAATPADAVAHVADADPSALTALAQAIRVEADRHEAMALPVRVAWEGTAGAAYARRAAALDDHLRGPGESLVQRLRATASSVDDVAAWQASARDDMAAAIADVLGSVQAATLRRPLERAAVLAAADIGARVLEAAARTLDEGERLAHHGLDELAYRAPADGPTASPGIRLDQ